MGPPEMAGFNSKDTEYRRSSNLPQNKEVEYFLQVDMLYLFHIIFFSMSYFQIHMLGNEQSWIDNYISLVKQKLLFNLYFWPDCKASAIKSGLWIGENRLSASVCLSVRLSGVNNLRLAVAFSLVSHKPLMIQKSNLVSLLTLMSSSWPTQNFVTLTLTSRFSEHTLILTLACSLSHH